MPDENFWSVRRDDWTDPTWLVPDAGAGRGDPQPTELPVPSGVVAATARIAGGDSDLRRVVAAAALVLLAGRCTGRSRVTVLVASGEDFGPNRAVPLSVDVTGQESGRDLLGAVRTEYLAVREHLDVSVQTLLDEAGTRPADLVVSIDGGLPVDAARVLGARLHFDLVLTGPAPVVRLSYDHGAFTAGSAAELARTYLRLLGELVTAPAGPVAPLLAADEPDLARIDAFNRTAAPFPADRLLHSFLEERAAADPDSIALADDGTTYGQLNAEANRLAHELRARGVGPDDVVGVCLPRSRAAVVAVYGVLKAGGAYLPVDPAQPADRIGYVLGNSRVRLVVAAGAVAGDHEVVRCDGPGLLARPVSDPDPVTTPDNLCYVIYTSGSTGRPKGVTIEHRAIVNRLWWMQQAYPLQAADVVLHKTPITFDVSVWELFWWSLAGCAVVTLAEGAERDPSRIIERIREGGVTTLHFVPSMLQAFLQFVAASDAAGELSGVRRLFASGEALTPAQVRLFHQVFGGGAGLVNLYGPTEAAVDVTHHSCDDPAPALVPIGRPISNTTLAIRSPSGAVVPIGTPGELCLAGAGLARGYLHAEELTRERFLRAGDGERYYRTGDLARWLPDGTVEYLGRIDDQVKIRGLRIEPGEIEHVAARAPGVAQCAVAVRQAAGRDASLVAYVVTTSDYDERSLLATFARELPGYMVPSAIVPVAAIPTGRHGKRDLSALPAPDRSSGVPYRAPDTPAERTSVAIWSEVLGVERVGVDDNFYNLGGDSISFLTVLARSRAAGLPITFQQLFRNPTVAAVCRSTDAGPEEEPARRVPDEPFALVSAADRELLPAGLADAYPMSALQTGLIYEATRSGTEGLYHDVLSYRIHDRVDVALFERAVELLVSRHAILRTAFRLDGLTEPMQLVHENAASPLQVFDLRGLSALEQEAELARFAGRELSGGFHYGTTDLVRIHLHLLGDREYQYSLSYHDAALDGWSVNTLHRDVFSAYFTLLDGGDAGEVAGPVGSHRQYVELERAAVADPAQGAFWLGVLDGAESTRIPAYADPDPDRGGVGIVDVDLPDDVAEGVVELARRLGVPVKTTLLAAHVAVLAFVTGSTDVLTGYEHSGRPEVEGGQDIVGLHLNTLPFRLDRPGTTWSELVAAVYDAEQRLLPWRRYPMAEMKKALRRRDALFETVFNFTHFRVLKEVLRRDGFELARSIVNVQSEFPFRAEFCQDAVTDRVLLALHHHRAVYTEAQVERIGGYYRRALQAMVADPTAVRSAAGILGAAERAELAAVSHGPSHPLPDQTVVDLIAAQAARTPARIALQHNGTSLDYATVLSRSDRYAAHLAAAGVRAGDVVVTLLPRGVDWALTMLAVFRLGAVYLPQDRSHPVERIGAVLRRSGSRHVVIDPADEPALGARLSATTEGLRLTSVGAGLPSRPAPARPGPAPHDPAYVIFTSGSTGEPKGATIRHSGMVNHLLSKVLTLGLTEADRVAQISTQCFDISVWQLLVAWLTGGRTVIYDESVVLDLPVFLRALAGDRITVLETVPSYTDALLTVAAQQPFPLPELRYNIINGEALPPALTRRWFEHYAITALNAYGPTECSDDVTHHVMHAGHDGARVPVGRPIINTAIHVLGADARPRPIGSYGEICVTGAGVGLGYIHDEERTAEVFVPNTVDDTSLLMYRTGDIGRWLPGGLLDCAGRRDGQVKIRGFRIELSDIDGALDRLDGVDVAVTLARTVGSDKHLVTFYTGTAEPDREVFRERLAVLLPDYLHPEIFIRLDAFPLNANGKIDRRVLAARPVRLGGTGRREAPAGPTEVFVRDLFASALGVEPADVGVTDNFFDLGGHSITAMKVAALSRGRIALRELLVNPTARLLADRLEQPREQERELLVGLGPAARDADPAHPMVVCLPFAGGGAVSYQPLARTFEERGAAVRVYGVELPVRTADDPRPAVDLDTLVRQLADEVRARAGEAPVLVLGHCAGASVALHLARELERRGAPAERLIIVSKLMRSTDPADHASNDVVHMSVAEILDWLVVNTGLTEVHALDPAQQDALAVAFRYDTVLATRGLHRAVSDVASHTVTCPATIVLAADDSLMTDHHAFVGNWARFVPEQRLVVAERGGHYLNTTRPDLLADTVQRDLQPALESLGR